MRQPSYLIRHTFLRRALGLKIGPDSSIHYGCFIAGGEQGAKISIGANSVINRFTYLDGRFDLKIGNNVNISHYTIIQTLSHDVQSPEFLGKIGAVNIGDHVWIGTRSTILPGVDIGEGAVVGAGSVVTKSVDPFTIVAGCPAKKIGTRNRSLTYKTRYFPLFNSDIQL